MAVLRKGAKRVPCDWVLYISAMLMNTARASLHGMRKSISSPPHGSAALELFGWKNYIFQLNGYRLHRRNKKYFLITNKDIDLDLRFSETKKVEEEV